MNTPTSRDTVLVLGPSAAGKTEFLNLIRAYLGRQGVPFVMKPHSDSHTILEWMYLDDENGGKNHYHNWCPNQEEHDHLRNKETIPFTLSGNFVAHGMMKDFFEGLIQAPMTRQIRFAEWSGGVNINPTEDLASRTDLSFGTIARLLRDGTFRREGFGRVLAVVHIRAHDSVRNFLNDQRYVPQPEQIELGTASWPLALSAMRIFGEDDAEKAMPLFVEAGVPHIEDVINLGDKEGFQKSAEHIMTRVLETWGTQEGQIGARPEKR